MTPVKKAKTEVRLVVTLRSGGVDSMTKRMVPKGTRRAYGKRDIAHARKDAEAYETNPDKSAHIETRTVTAWSKVEEE